MNSNDFLLEYDPLIYSVINRFSYYYDRDDLYQVGMMGLIKASKTFDETRDTKFSSYAYLSVVGEVLKFVREDKAVKSSRNVIRENQAIERARDALTQKLMRVPSNEELAVFLEMDVDHIDEVQRQNGILLSLDSMVNGVDEEANLYGVIKTEEKGYDENILDLNVALERLDPLERQLIKARYFEDKSQMEVSQELGISQSKASRNEAKVLVKMRQDLVA